MMKKQPTLKYQWNIQRLLKKQPIPSPKQCYILALKYDNLMERALFLTLYLTAGRISEVLPKPYLIKNYFLKDSTGKVQLNSNKSQIIEKTERIPLDYAGIKRKDVFFDTINKKKVMVFSLQNRKNKQILRKNVPVSITKEATFIKLIYAYLRLKQPEEVLFPFSQAKGHKIVKKTGLNPHYLRDIRLTHMVTKYNYNSQQLIKFAGWKTIAPAEYYIRLGIQDLVDNF